MRVNQWWKSRKRRAGSNLVDTGRSVARNRPPAAGGERSTPGPVVVVGQEATVKVCGVSVARLLGYSWAPP